MKLNKNNLLRLVLLFSIITGFYLESFAQNKQALFEAKINKDKINVGEAIQLDLIFANTTKALITAFDENPERSVDIFIKNHKGIVLPLTKEGRRKKFPDIVIHREGIYLEPGRKLNWKIDLTEFFDIDHPGNYELIAKKEYFSQNLSTKEDKSATKVIAMTSRIKFKIIR